MAYQTGNNAGNRRRIHSVRILAAAAGALLAAANAVADAAENPTRLARVHHACAVVMGLLPPGEPYKTCIRSLNKSLSDLDQARLLSENRRGCTQQGLIPGTPAFAACVITAEQSPAGTGPHGAIAALR